MSDFVVCVNAVLPLFIIMGLGYAARRLGAIRREDVPRLNKMAFRFFLPVLLFYNIYTSDLSSAVQPKLLLFTAVCVLCLYGLSFGYVLMTEKSSDKRGVMIQGIYRSNFVIMGIPLAKQLVQGADLGCVVMLAMLASAVLALFLDRKVSAAPEMAPDRPALLPDCRMTMMMRNRAKIASMTVRMVLKTSM